MQKQRNIKPCHLVTASLIIDVQGNGCLMLVIIAHQALARGSRTLGQAQNSALSPGCRSQCTHWGSSCHELCEFGQVP